MNRTEVARSVSNRENTENSATVRDDIAARGWSFHRDLSVLTSGLCMLFGSGALMEREAQAAAPTVVHRTYDVVREGSTIGTIGVDETRRGDVLEITTTTDIRVKIAFVEVYRYEQSATETWRAGKLVTFRSRTNDNGTRHVVALIARDGGTRTDVDGKAEDVPALLVPATLWVRPAAGPLVMIDPNGGKRLNVTAADAGAEGELQHVRYTGDLPRDLWFSNGTLVKMQMAGSDGSRVVTQLRR